MRLHGVLELRGAQLPAPASMSACGAGVAATGAKPPGAPSAACPYRTDHRLWRARGMPHDVSAPDLWITSNPERPNCLASPVWRQRHRRHRCTSLGVRSAASGGAPARRSLDGIKIIARCGANYPRLVALSTLLVTHFICASRGYAVIAFMAPELGRGTGVVAEVGSVISAVRVCPIRSGCPI